MIQKRIKWVDIYKGLLIFLVVFGHALQGISADRTLVNNQFYDSILYGKWLIYSFHMPAFFIAAGFFSSKMFNKISKSYFIKRSYRLIIPYFIWSGITAICMQLAKGHTNNELGINNLLYSPIIPFSIFWFLYIYFIIFVIHFSLTIFLKEKSNLILLILGIILFLINPFLPVFWIIKPLTQFMIFYAIGLYVLTFVESNFIFFSSKKYTFLEFILFIIAFIFYFVAMKNKNNFTIYYLLFFTSITASALFINISIIISKIDGMFSNFNAYLGKYSMQIYVMHLLPLAFSRIVILHYLHISNLWIVSLVITAISLLVCLIIIKLTTRFHLNKVLFGA